MSHKRKGGMAKQRRIDAAQARRPAEMERHHYRQATLPPPLTPEEELAIHRDILTGLWAMLRMDIAEIEP